MCAMQLTLPAKGRLDLAVGHAVTISNHEMVADPKPWLALRISPLAMLGVDRLDASLGGCRMMQHQVFPGARGNF